jgi:hypothetical protein
MLHSIPLSFEEMQYAHNILGGTDPTCMIAAIRAIQTHFWPRQAELLHAAREKAQRLESIELLLVIWPHVLIPLIMAD